MTAQVRKDMNIFQTRIKDGRKEREAQIIY